MSQQLMEYHPPKTEKFGSPIIPGTYTILELEFTTSEKYGEVVNLLTSEGLFYTFSGVLRKQLKMMLESGIKLPQKVTVKGVKKYLTLV